MSTFTLGDPSILRYYRLVYLCHASKNVMKFFILSSRTSLPMVVAPAQQECYVQVESYIQLIL